MRLADFIDANIEAILSSWESFALTLLPAARHLDSLALRDHAQDILRAISADLRTAQTRRQQEEKSQGGGPHLANETAAQTHAVLRAASGFSVRQLVGEYRALRASVLRQYRDRNDGHDAAVAEDVDRFNEAIDQAVAESVDYFTSELERWRNIFLGILGHDLRGPLNSILLTAELISQKGDSTAHIDRVIRSGKRMAELLDDLLDFNRATLGGRLQISPAPADLAEACRQEVELQRSAHPSAAVDLEAPQSCPGVWDVSRLRQAVGNLVGNAIKYGRDGRVRVRVEADEAMVRVTVENEGRTLDASEQERIFDPLVRGLDGLGDTSREHLGLGLFIVRQAVEAHGGTIGVESAEGRTRFTVTLPRDATQARGAA